MSKTACHSVLLVLAFFLLPPAVATAQGKEASAAQKSTSDSPKTSKTPSKQALQSITLVSTAEAVRKVAEEESAKVLTPKGATRGRSRAGAKQEVDGAVHEFRPVDGLPATDSFPGTFQAKSHKKSVLKNIHGKVYGATASEVGRANGEGGAVGADSSNGKFNIYVEGEHIHGNTPAPH